LRNYQIKASIRKKKNQLQRLFSVHWPNKIGGIDISDRFNICFLYSSKPRNIIIKTNGGVGL
jgi:hypothetical protein